MQVEHIFKTLSMLQQIVNEQVAATASKRSGFPMGYVQLQLFDDFSGSFQYYDTDLARLVRIIEWGDKKELYALLKMSYEQLNEEIEFYYSAI